MHHTPNSTIAGATQHQPTDQLIHDLIINWLREETGQTISQIGFDQPFFELGVDSLGAFSIANELEQRTNKKLDPNEVYELETISQLAGYVDSLPCNGHASLESNGHSPKGAPTNGPPSGNSLLDHYERMNRRVDSLKSNGLYFFEPTITEQKGAWIVADGKRMLMLASYEYLGLLGDSRINRAAAQAIDQFGTGHHGVRLLAGTTAVHRQLESKLAALMKAQDSIVYASGYVANLSTISALVGPGDCVIGDQWNHASIVDGCRQSGARFLEFRHNDIGSLSRRLRACATHRILVVVDAVYSMDGDIARLPEIIDCCRDYGALLMVDEAHSLGVLGETGAGIQQHFGLEPGDIDIKMGTLSKALASCGGFVAARESIVSYLRHHARGYIFSGALPAVQAQAAISALDAMESEPERVRRLRDNVARYLDGLRQMGLDTGKSVTPIVPIMTGTNDRTLEMTRVCRSNGLFVVPVCYPAVPMDAPRLRTCVSAIHSSDDIDFALSVLHRAARAAGLIA